MRLFLALDIPDAVKDDIAGLHDKSLMGAQWTTRQQWHLTLHFIGERDDDNVLRAALADVKASAFMLRLAGVGQFPEQGKPRVLWAGIHAPEMLQTLHELTGNALAATGYQPETRPFSPHLTLARFKRQTPQRHIMQAYFEQHHTFKTALFSVSQFTLYESQLLQQGAVYTPRATFALASA
jgi:RNA 2',3'-cyclic 3'-phosphodiesterase